MASSIEVATDSDWDLCDDALPPGTTTTSEPSAGKQSKKDSLTETTTGLRSTYPDPKFYPAEATKEGGPDNEETESYPEGDSLRRTLVDMGFSVSPEALPKSFLLAASNRFTKEQVEQFTADLKLGFNNPLPYFFCGSFIFPATLRAITNGMTLKSIAGGMCPATLCGFERRRVSWAEWPAIVPASDEATVVHGMAVFGIQDSQRARIHRFEGGMFDLRRATIQITLEDGTVWNHEAGVYVWNGGESKLVPVEDENGQYSPDLLLGSSWHARNIAYVADEERELAESGRSRLAADW